MIKRSLIADQIAANKSEPGLLECSLAEFECTADAAMAVERKTLMIGYRAEKEVQQKLGTIKMIGEAVTNEATIQPAETFFWDFSD
ncbi:MAG: hypothetical protein JSU59_03325, partial [Nitrospirota bacterium]